MSLRNSEKASQALFAARLMTFHDNHQSDPALSSADDQSQSWTPLSLASREAMRLRLAPKFLGGETCSVPCSICPLLLMNQTCSAAANDRALGIL